MQDAFELPIRKRRTKRLVAVMALLLPCFAMVSCKPEQFYKIKLRADGQATEQKITGAAMPYSANSGDWRFTIWRYSMVIDGPDAANVAGATAMNKRDSFDATIGHEDGKCTVSWEAPRRDIAFTASFNVVLSHSDGSKTSVAYKYRPTALGVTTGIVVSGLWLGLIGAIIGPLF